MRHRWCVVPQCTNTSVKTPEKIFVSIPMNTKIRRKWLMLARRNPKDISGSTNAFMCEDHFNLEQDMENYMQYKMGFSQNVLMVKGALPSKFHCQIDRRKRLSDTSKSRKAYIKPSKTDIDHIGQVAPNVPETAVEVVELYEMGTPIEDCGAILPDTTVLENSQQSKLNLAQFLEYLETTFDAQICRVCLVTDCNMKLIKNSLIDEIFKKFFDDDTSGMVCWECYARMCCAVRLKEKAQLAQTVLKKLMNMNQVNLNTLNSINRQELKLASHLGTVSILEIKLDPVIAEIKQEIVDDNESAINDDDENGIDDITPVYNVPITYLKVEVDDANDVSFNDDVTRVEAVSVTDLCVGINKEENSNAGAKDRFRKQKQYPGLRHLKKIEPRLGNLKKTEPGLKHLKKTEPGLKHLKKEAKDKVKKQNAKKSEKASTGKFKTPKNEKQQVYDSKEEMMRRINTWFIIKKLTPQEQKEALQKKKKDGKIFARPYKCTICYTAFYQEIQCNTHMARHKEDRGKFECDICKVRFKSKARVRLHIVMMHTEEFTCVECAKTLKTRYSASKHAKYHEGNMYQCSRCPAKFRHYTSYMGHKRLKHVAECEHVCDICGFAFLSENGVSVHKNKRHLPEELKVV